MISEIISKLTESWPFTLCTIIFLIVIIQYRVKRGRRCTLPGPKCWPILGYLPDLLGKYPARVFLNLRNEFGPVFQIQLGLHTVVVMNSFEAIQRASRDINFADRPNIQTMRGRLDGTTQGFFIALNANDKWRFLRKTASRSLGMFASSKNSRLEEVSNQAKASLFKLLDEHNGAPFNPRSAISKTVTAVIASLVYGADFDPDSEVLDLIGKQSWTNAQFQDIRNPMNRFPYGKLYLKRRLTAEYYKLFLAILEMTRQNAMKEKDHDEIRDVADALFKILHEISPEDFAKIGCDSDAIIQCASMLFTAGFLTTLDNFHFLMNYMAYFQDVQRKAQQEIDAALKGRPVTLEDKSQLPYVEAVINEMFRFATPLPYSVQHATACDLLFDGYFIPAGTEVVMNVYAIHMDPEIFHEPYEFTPERFITSNGGFDTDHAHKVQPFGIGKRRCVGEVMARQELFMLFVGVLQNYNLRVAPGETEKFEILWEDGGINRLPHPWKLIFERRREADGM